jgi:hypothetical protein
MHNYVITFQRIGRHRGGSQLTAAASTVRDLEQAIAGHADQILESTPVAVDIRQFDAVTGAGDGTLYTAGRSAGRFTIAPAAPAGHGAAGS